MLILVTHTGMLDPHTESCMDYHPGLSTKMDHKRYMKDRETHAMDMPLLSIGELQWKEIS